MTMAERLNIHREMESGNRMRERMVEYIKTKYPDAVLEWYVGTAGRIEYVFLPYPGADEPYTCVTNVLGGFSILTGY